MKLNLKIFRISRFNKLVTNIYILKMYLYFSKHKTCKTIICIKNYINVQRKILIILKHNKNKDFYLI